VFTFSKDSLLLISGLNRFEEERKIVLERSFEQLYSTNTLLPNSNTKSLTPHSVQPVSLKTLQE
jgi:hypothetical protein